MSPLVSICIPTYNGALFIEDALESVINQTYNNLEIVVSDDASSDTTLSIVERFRDKTNIPIYVYHHQPKGIGANWNNCMKQSKGDYIKFLFQDDVLMPTCVEDMVIIMETEKRIGLVACKRVIIHADDYNPKLVLYWKERFGDLQKRLNLQYINGVSVLDKTIFKHKQFLRSPLNKIGEPTALMFRKSLITQVGYFKEDLNQILDYEFCYRVLKKKSVAIIETPLVKFRLHEFQATNINKKSKNKTENEGFSKILHKDYLDYVDPYIKKHLRKKHHIMYKSFYAIKARIKKLFN